MKQTAAFALTALLAVGCTTLQAHETLTAPARILEGQAVTVLAPGPGVFGQGDDDSFAECVRGVLHRTSPTLRVIPPQEFRDALFPWFEPGIAPGTPEQLALLLEKPLLQDRIARLGVRYVISVRGLTAQGDAKGAILCGVSYRGGGCLGFAWMGRESTMSAVVWDLEQPLSPGTVDVTVSGTIFMPAFILPIPIPVFTETRACAEIAEKLAEFLGGGGPQSPTQPWPGPSAPD